MKFIIERAQLLKPLQQVSVPFCGRPPLPILNNLLLQVNDNILSITGTNLEIEIVVNIELKGASENGSITVLARKFFDIWRGLPDNTEIKVSLEGDRLLIYFERSHFSLSTLPANNFPNIDYWKSKVEFELPQTTLKYLIEGTQFSMAHQDARYYLNGMLFETEGKELRTVATDGHRLAVCSLNINKNLPKYSVIVPRKGVIEFMRLLNNSNKPLKLNIGANNIRAHMGNFIFTSKLIDGVFPDYQSVLSKKPDKILTADSDKLKQAFSRAAILSNEKIRGVRLYLTKNQLRITANNQEQEESEEILDVHYQNAIIEIAFNVNYILDVLNTLKCQNVNLLLTDSNSSMQIKDVANNRAVYVIMPIRL